MYGGKLHNCANCHVIFVEFLLSTTTVFTHYDVCHIMHVLVSVHLFDPLKIRLWPQKKHKKLRNPTNSTVCFHHLGFLGSSSV